MYHKKKINDAIDIYNNQNNNANNNKNNAIIPSGNSSIGHKTKSSFSNMANRGGSCGSTSPQSKEKLIRISEFKMEGIGQNTNENKYSLNNSKNLINRLKNQAFSLKNSITHKNQVNNNNINKNKVINCFQFDDKENLYINKHIQNELSHCHLVKGINILNKDETFEIEHKKYANNDKNKFNKNSCFFNNEKNNNSNNIANKNYNSKDHELLRKIKNLKTFHPTKFYDNKKTISIKVNKDINLENRNMNVNTLSNAETKNDNISLKDKNRNISKSNNRINKSKDKIKYKERNNSKGIFKEKKSDKTEKDKEKENKPNKKNISEEKEKLSNNDKNKISKNNTNIIDNKNKEKELIKKEKEENLSNKEEITTIVAEKDHTIKNTHKNKTNNKEKGKEKENKNEIEEENKEIKNSNKKTPVKKSSNSHDEPEHKKEEENKEKEEKVIYFDTSNISNVQIPKDYLNIIYYNLLQEESIELDPKPTHTYMKNQKEINDQMRSILVDWIIDVHHKFGFTDETLFMTILIIDRYCSIEQVSRIKYQCLGITALMIACKHEEINVPKVEDFIYITDNAYTKEEVFKMENDVLSKLNFSLLYPSPIKFYEYLSLHFNFSKKYHMLGKYLMESFLLDLKYIKYKPSIISCACTYIVMKFFKMSNYRQSYDKKFYLVDENVNTIGNGLGVKDCAQDICVFVDNINNTNLLSCQKKYTKPEFESVSTLISNNKA